jgi:hypothetical protein
MYINCYFVWGGTIWDYELEIIIWGINAEFGVLDSWTLLGSLLTSKWNPIIPPPPPSPPPPPPLNCMSVTNYNSLGWKLGWKLWPTNVGIEILLHQWGDGAWTKKAQGFFFSWEGPGKSGMGIFCFVFYVPNVFSSSSQNIPQITDVFHKMFPIPAHKCPIYFAQKLSSFQLYR